MSALLRRRICWHLRDFPPAVSSTGKSDAPHAERQRSDPFSGFNGFLDASGAASGQVAVPAFPAIVGLGLDFGFVTFDATTFALRHPSGAAHVTIVP